MSTFQRITILLAFACIGLATAALIVHAPLSLVGESFVEKPATALETSPTGAGGANETNAQEPGWLNESLDVQAQEQGQAFLPPKDLPNRVEERLPAHIEPLPMRPNAGAKLILPETSPFAERSSTKPLPPLPLPLDSIRAASLFLTEQDSASSMPSEAELSELIDLTRNVPGVTPSLETSLQNPLQATSRRVVAASAPRELLPEEGDGLLDINIPNTDIREVLQLLSKAGDLNILASRNVSGEVKATLTGVDVDTALSAILRSTGYLARREGDFVYVGTAQDFQAMDHAIDRISTRVYRPNYITAAEFQTLVTPMLTPAVGTISVSSAAEVGIGSDSASAGGNNFAGAEVVLVRDYEAALAQIDQVFHEVDRRPLQVSIEAMILSVKLTNDQSLGVDWELFRRNNNVRLVFGSPPASTGAINTENNSGLVFGYLDTNVAFFLDALEEVGETHVISQPRLMCLNKQRAEIHIGEERGYVSTTVTETSATQSVEFLEVGTQLRLRPYISSDGLIRLEVHPELSTGTVEVSDNFTLPNKTVTQVTTNVMVRDGATLVIGGLLREDLQMDTSQIPLLGSLPVVGPLFRSKTDKTERDEIIVLITPRIVWEPRFNCEGEYADCEAHQQHAMMADKMSPISRTFYGRKYRRLAKAAWIAGDAKSALRYINLSIHFNRLDRESIQLRSEIIAGSGLGDHNVHTHLKQGLYPWQHPTVGAGLTDWVLDELHGPHTHLGQEPAQINNAGVSGPSRDLFVPPLREPAEFVVPEEQVEGELIAPEGT